MFGQPIACTFQSPFPDNSIWFKKRVLQCEQGHFFLISSTKFVSLTADLHDENIISNFGNALKLRSRPMIEVHGH